MNSIQITTSYNKNYTSIPNFFIDEYLSSANGDFVKVYIWLIKQVDTGQGQISVRAIADAFNFTETDVIRAIKYWQSAGVIEASWKDKLLTSIHILDKGPSQVTQAPLVSASETIDISEPQVIEPVMEKRPEKPHYSTSELVSYKTQDDYSQLVFITESLIGKPLKEQDLRTLISLHDWLGLPFDVIELLIEYCVTNNHRKLSYIEKVAIDWADDGVTSLDKAKYRTKTHTKNFFTIFQALGIQNRNPVQFEIDLMTQWTNAFNMDVILEACHRTVVQTNSGSMKYTDSILKDWAKNNVKNFSDIEALDKAFNDKKKTTKNTSPSKKPNKFNNYDQRDYDFDQLEKKAFEMRMKQTKEQ